MTYKFLFGRDITKTDKSLFASILMEKKFRNCKIPEDSSIHQLEWRDE